MKLLSLTLIILLLLNCINLNRGETIVLNADSCVNLACKFANLFNNIIPSALDDVIVKTSSSAIQAVILLSESMSIKSLNISNGVIKVASGGLLSVSTNILVQAGSSLSIEGTSTCDSLFLNGGSLNLVGTLTVKKELNLTASINIGSTININGTLNVQSLNCLSNSPLPLVSGNAIINLNGNSNLLSGLSLIDNAQLNIKSGICIINGLIKTTTNAIINNLATLNIAVGTNSVQNITCGIKLNSNSITNIIGSKVNLLNIVSITESSAINLSKSSILSIFNKNSISLGPITIDPSSTLILDNTICIINKQLQIVKGSLIHLRNKASLQIDLALDFINDFEIENSANLILGGATSTISGIVKNAVGSVITLAKGTCIFKTPIVIETFKILDSATTAVNVLTNVTINSGITCSAPSSSITIDPVVGILNLGGSSLIKNVINLSGSSQFNIVNKGVCIINQIIPTEKSIINVFAGSNLTVTTSSIFNQQSINLHGNSILQFIQDVTFNGLKVFPIDKLSLPIISLQNSNCKFNGEIDPLGSITLVKSILSLADKVVLNINNNIIVDIDSSFVLPKNANLIISGPGSVISSLFTIDGKLNIEKGAISFNGGIESSASSMVFCNNANVAISASSNFNGPFSATGTGSIDIHGGETHFHQGVKIDTSKCAFNIRKSSFAHIHAESQISSPIYCLNNSTLNIVSVGSNVILDGGLSSEIDAKITIDNSVISLNSTSNILGSVSLNNTMFISCGITKLQGAIHSIVPGVIGNNTLSVNSGSCFINTSKEVELTGSINVMAKAALSIDSPKSICHGGIKNSGVLTIASLVDLKTSAISQLNGEASLVLLKGSNIITESANFASGEVSGNGKITISSSNSSSPCDTCHCESGGILSGLITIDGKLKLLDSSVLRVNIASSTDVSKIVCTGAVTVNGLVNVLFDSDLVEATLKIGDSFPILSSSVSIIGNLSLSDTKDSNQFSCKPSTNGGKDYYLIYQQTTKPVNKGASSIDSNDNDDTSNSPSSFNNLHSLCLLLVTLLLLLLNH